MLPHAPPPTDTDADASSLPPARRSRKPSASQSKHRRGGSLDFLMDMLAFKDSAEEDADGTNTPPSPTSSREPPTPKEGTHKGQPQSEKRLMQAHDLTRALFACIPCQMVGGRSRQIPRAGIGSYYLPTDLLEESEVLPYCGVEVEEADALHQNYDMMRV